MTEISNIMLVKLLTKVFGSRNDRTLRRMRKSVELINQMEPDMEKLSDDELKEPRPMSSARAWKRVKCWKTCCLRPSR
jgi:preprotein translocase subunit SecA